MRRTRPARALLVVALVTFVVGGAASVLWDQLAPHVIGAVHHDPSYGPLHDLLQTHARVDAGRRDPAYYVRNGRIVLTRLLIAAAGIALLIWGLVFRRDAIAFLRTFFGATAPPTSLAVFRIVVFSVLLVHVTSTDTAFYSELPLALRMPPLGLQWLSSLVPISAPVASGAKALFIVAGIAAILGLFSRTSACVALVLAAYGLGVPQIFGSMNADHHLLWFAAILAASRCGDVLSLDAVRAARRDADRGVIAPPGPARAYALPLRFVWLLLGIVYFFPGFWKLWRTGLEWVSAENLRHHMLLKWAEFHDWMPFFRIDEHPVLLSLGALGTVVFELSVVVLVLTPRGRLLAAAAGLAFHNMSFAFLNISFWYLQAMYVALVDWAAALRRLGRVLYRLPMTVVYDGNCRLCLRTVATLRRFDVFERIEWVRGLDPAGMAAHRLIWLDPGAVAADMHAVVGRRVWRGFAAYQAIAARIPVLWPAYPLLHLWPLTVVGRRLYRHAADSRSCALAPPPQVGSEALAVRPVAAVGGLLVLGTVVLGITRVHMSWPLLCYPDFAWIAQPVATRLGVTVTDVAGRVTALDVRELNGRSGRRFTPERLQGLIIAILRENGRQREDRLRALWDVLARENAGLEDARIVRFYKDTVPTLPERQHEPPRGRELIYELVIGT